MDVESLIASLRQNKINPIYLVVGEQDYLMDQIIRSFTNLIPDEEKSMNYAQYDMENVSISNALDDAMSPPFFGEHRLIIITHPYFLTGNTSHSNVKHDLDSLDQYLKSPLESTILVFLAPYSKLDNRKKITKDLKKYSKFTDISNISEYQTRKYVTNTIKQKGYKIDNQAMNYLIQRTDGQLSVIMNQISKLFLYCQNDKVISSSAVKGLITKSLNQNVFDLVNFVLEKRINQAINLYHELLLENKKPLQINAILVSQFRLLLQVMILSNHGVSQGKLSNTLKVHPYRIKLALRTVRKFNLNHLQNAYLGLVNIESKLKSTQQSPELLFEIFMMQFIDKMREEKTI